MAGDLREHPEIEAELDAIAYLESKRGKYLRPSDPMEFSFGRYHINALSLVDAAQNGIAVPKIVADEAKDWNTKSTSDRWQAQGRIFGWMLKNQQDVDLIAETYYSDVVRPQAGGGVPAIMEWHSPGSTKKDYEALGLTPKEINSNPKALERFITHIESNGSDVRSSRIRDLKPLLPLLDYGKAVEPAKPGTLPTTPVRPPSNWQEEDARFPYPVTELSDPWLQYGHAVEYQNSMKDYASLIGTKEIIAATRAKSALDQDPEARRILQKSYGSEAVQPAMTPPDLALELTVPPYGIAHAITDVVEDQMHGGSFTEGFQQAGWMATPFIVGGILSSRMRGIAKSRLLGQTTEASPQQVEAAKDVFSKQLEAARQVREGIQAQLQAAKQEEFLFHGGSKESSEIIEKQGFLGGLPEDTYLTSVREEAETFARQKGGKVFAVRREDVPDTSHSRGNWFQHPGKLSIVDPDKQISTLQRELSQAQRKEDFLATILDNDKGEAEIRRLEYWRDGLRDEGAPISQIKDVEKRIEAAQNRLQEAKDVLRLPSRESYLKAVEFSHNLNRSAKFPEAAQKANVDELISSRKVSLESIANRELDAMLTPDQIRAEEIVVQKLTKHLEELDALVKKRPDDLLLAREQAIAFQAAMLVVPKVSRSETRIAQSLQAMKGKSGELRTLQEVSQNLTPESLPAFMGIWKTATTDAEKLGQLRRLANPGVLKGATMQVLTNNLIASPAVAFWNVMSMATMTASRLNELRILSKIDPTHNAPDQASTFAAALVGYYAKLIRGDVKARAAFGEAISEASLRNAGDKTGLTRKYNFRDTISAQGLGATGAWGVAADRLGYFINLPTQFTAWSDAVVSVGLKEGFTKSAASNQAWMELQGELERGAKLTQEQIQVRLAKREQEIWDNPNSMTMVDGKAVRIADVAAENAAVIAMMGKLQTKAANFIENAASDSLLARLVIPFWHPFLQTSEMALERAPLIGRYLPHMQAELAAGGARAAAAQAKIATGNQTAAVFAMFAGMAHLTGDSDWAGFTGSGPTNDNQKSWWATTHRADTIRIGGKEMSLTRLGPVGMVMSYTADVMGALNELTMMGDKANNDIAADLTLRLVSAWTSLVTSELFAEDVKDIVDGMVSLDFDALERTAERKAGALIPGSTIMRDFNRLRTDTNQIMQWKNGPIKWVAPRNTWGDYTRYYGDQNIASTLLGFTERNAPDFDRKNAIVEKLYKDDVAVVGIGKTITASGISLEISTEQQMELRRYMGEEPLPLPNGGRGTLLQGLEQMVNKPIYAQLVRGAGDIQELGARMAKGSKQAFINAYVSERKQAAIGWLLTKSEWAEELQMRLKLAGKRRQFDLDHPDGPPVSDRTSILGTMTSPFSLGGER